jgi:hypothetical protein
MRLDCPFAAKALAVVMNNGHPPKTAITGIEAT